MFTIYIDDSGTAPEHKVAVAAGIVVSAAQIPRLESEWNKFLKRERIPEFHASECQWRNQHSPFAAWDDKQVRRIFTLVRQLTIRFSVKGFCIGIHKQDYDEVLTAGMQAAIGNSHYTWALSSVIGLAEDFSKERKAPMNYVFDNAGKLIRREVIDALEFMGAMEPERFSGNWMFGKRGEIPGLQAVDLFAWTCFQQFRRVRFGTPIPAIADEVNGGYEGARNGEWRTVQSLSREGIEKWVRENHDNPRTQEIIAFKKKLKESKQKKK